VDVDSAAKTVTGNDGSVTPYDVLLLATGSNAFMPPIQGLDKDGVFVFRTLDDTRALLARSGKGVKAIVIGGGLLGLEAARGLQVQGCDVTVVHLMSTLMERQLDPDGGQYLLGKIEDLGVKVMLGRTTTAILGNGHVEGVALSDDSIVEADLVVVAAGIRPNVDLAIKAGLAVNRGRGGSHVEAIVDIGDVQRILAGMVSRGPPASRVEGADRVALARVDDEDIRVKSNGDPSLRLTKAEAFGRIARAHPRNVGEADQSVIDQFEHRCQQRLESRHAARNVSEGWVEGGLLLTRVGCMIGADDIDKAVGHGLSQGIDIGPCAKGRRCLHFGTVR